MQAEYATAPLTRADAGVELEETLLLAVVVEPSCATSFCDEPPQPAAGRPSAAVAMIAAAVRASTPRVKQRDLKQV
jgi:hypothetical protein